MTEILKRVFKVDKSFEVAEWEHENINPIIAAVIEAATPQPIEDERIEND